MRRFFASLLLGCIGFYRRYLSALKPRPTCRYLPTCSEYAEEAIRCCGLGRGTLLTTWRLLRCNPFGGSGFNPVPPRKMEV